MSPRHHHAAKKFKNSNIKTAPSLVFRTKRKNQFHGPGIMYARAKWGIFQVALSLSEATKSFDPVLPQMQWHLAKHHGLVLVV